MGKLQQVLDKCIIALPLTLICLSILVEKNPNYAELAKYIFEKIEHGDIHAITSSLVIA
ncbi:hypothetical protein [Caldicellulosiruptor owensensis]|uniref:hypothetical protein n=1 Tax=Caldicellulosiruptor owensensis TaxID=55205 RepID=UPI00030D6043|nr:hypothetical protein [Caldicellulosiruptor owensensis]